AHEGPRAGAGRRRQDPARGRLGPGPARSRRADHPRMGRGVERRRGAGPGPGVRPSDPSDAEIAGTVGTLRRQHPRGGPKPGGHPSSRVPCMNVPEDLRYTADHEWARLEGNRVRVGITDYAQDALGDVVYVQLPEPGASVAGGDSFSEVESTKSVSDI